MKQRSLTASARRRLGMFLSFGAFVLLSACTAEDLRFWEKRESVSGSKRGDGTVSPTGEGEDLPFQQRSWLPSEMVVIGDSIATGLLGGSKMGDVAPTEYVRYLIDGNSLQANLLALGESDKARFSPFTGRFLGNSVESRLRGWNPDISVFNPSVPGATAWDAEGMIAEAFELGYAFEFAFVEIGHNDFCMSNSTVDEFRAQYRKNLETILMHNPHSRLVLTSLLHVPSVFEAAPAAASAVKVNSWSGLSLNCSQVRDTMEHACDGWYSGKRTQFSAYVKVISDLAIQMQALYPEAKIVLSEAVSDPGFVKSPSLALDCFHPNQAGYSTLAEQLWSDLQKTGVLN